MAEQTMRMGLSPEVLGALIGRIHIDRATRRGPITLPGPNACFYTRKIWDACKTAEAKLEPLLDIDVNSPEAQVLRLQLSMIRSGVDSIPSVYVFNDDFTESSFCRRSTSRLSLELRP